MGGDALHMRNRMTILWPATPLPCAHLSDQAGSFASPAFAGYALCTSVFRTQSWVNLTLGIAVTNFTPAGARTEE